MRRKKAFVEHLSQVTYVDPDPNHPEWQTCLSCGMYPAAYLVRIPKSIGRFHTLCRWCGGEMVNETRERIESYATPDDTAGLDRAMAEFGKLPSPHPLRR